MKLCLIRIGTSARHNLKTLISITARFKLLNALEALANRAASFHSKIIHHAMHSSLITTSAQNWQPETASIKLFSKSPITIVMGDNTVVMSWFITIIMIIKASVIYGQKNAFYWEDNNGGLTCLPSVENLASRQLILVACHSRI